MEISEELNKKLNEWSEGNEYLYSVLCFCWERSIKTVACSAGNDKNPYPYISIIIDDISINYLNNIIEVLETVENIKITCDYRYSNNNSSDGISDEHRKTFTIYCQMHNRCEVFFKIAYALSSVFKEIKTDKGNVFYENTLRFFDMSHDEIKNLLKSGKSVGASMSTITEDFIKYSEYKKKEHLYANALLQFFSKRIRDTYNDYHGKYKEQNEYNDNWRYSL